LFIIFVTVRFSWFSAYCFKFPSIISIVLQKFLLTACRQTRPAKENHENFDANGLIEASFKLKLNLKID